MDFLDYSQFGLVEILTSSNFRVFKNRYDWYTMCIPVGFGNIISAMWQGANLIVRTDRGSVFIFDDFYSFSRI